MDEEEQHPFLQVADDSGDKPSKGCIASGPDNHSAKKNKNKKQATNISYTKILKFLLPYFWPKNKWNLRLRITGSFVLLFASKGVSLLLPVSYQNIVDALDTKELLIGWLLVYIIIRFVSYILVGVREVIFLNVSNQATREIVVKTFAHLHDLGIAFHLMTPHGQTLRLMDKGLYAITMLLNLLFFEWMPTLLELVLVCLMLLIMYGSVYAAITMTTVVLYVIWTFYVTERHREVRKQMNQKDCEAGGKAGDSLINFETVKHFTAEDCEVSRYNEALKQYFLYTEKSQALVTIINIGQGVLIASCLGVTMYLASQEILKGKATVGDLVAINAFILQIWTPLTSLSKSYRGINRAFAEIDRLFELLFMPLEIKEIPNALPLHVTNGTIEFKNVCFSYPPKTVPENMANQILKDISFRVEGGTTLAIVGESGGGKSTIFRLLSRLYDLDSGQILIDGQDIRQVTLKSLRSSIGIVPQDTTLFNESLKYNIGYGCPNIEDEEVFQQIKRAAQEAKLGSVVETASEEYNCLVGERGLRLSGGERQRVSIARILFKNPPILILDEATSSLDSTTEAEIQQALSEMSSGKTTITIAHRLSTIMNADKIIVLKGGSIVEQGTHNELVIAGGEYAKLWNAQQQSSPKM